jgi:hypothetical protein
MPTTIPCALILVANGNGWKRRAGRYDRILRDGTVQKRRRCDDIPRLDKDRLRRDVARLKDATRRERAQLKACGYRFLHAA